MFVRALVGGEILDDDAKIGLGFSPGAQQVLDAVERLGPCSALPEPFVEFRIRAEIGAGHAEPARNQPPSPFLGHQGAVTGNGYIDAEFGQVRDELFQLLVQ